MDEHKKSIALQASPQILYMMSHIQHTEDLSYLQGHCFWVHSQLTRCAGC